MERLGQLEPRISVLEDDFDEDTLEAEADNAEAAAVRPPPPHNPAAPIVWESFWRTMAAGCTVHPQSAIGTLNGLSACFVTYVQKIL